MTDYRKLRGDPEELVWAINYYISQISPYFPNVASFASLLPEEYYVFCACKRAINKYLWQNYASPNGNLYSGVVIGLNVEALYSWLHFQNYFIDMTPMDYDRQGFIDLCAASFDNLKPVAMNILNAPLPSLGVEERQRFLCNVPGYSEFMEARLAPTERLTLLKGAQFKLEEEVRILNWPELHKRLKTILTANGQVALLPWRLNKGHFISEIIFTENCGLSPPEIKNILADNGLTTQLREVNIGQFI